MATTLCNACAFSMISDYFSPKYRARASSIYTLGIYLGVAMSSMTIILVNNIGWRNSYRLVAGISLLVTIAVFFMYEPKRGGFNSDAKKLQVKILDQNQSKLSRVCSDIKHVLSSYLYITILIA